MSAVSNIVIADGASTPVNHTFSPSRVAPELVTYQDRSAGVIEGFNVITIGTRYADKGNSGQKVTIRVYAPTLAQTAPSTTTGIQPNPVQAYVCLATVEFVLPTASTTQNRKDLLAFTKNLLAQAVVTSAVQDLDPPF